jgi:predicted nucleic acid-binding protein
MSFLLDTNAVSEWTKPKPNPNLIAWLASVDEDRTFLSVITIAEIKFGIERLRPGQRRSDLESWLNGDLAARFEGKLLPVNAAVAEAWGKITAGRAAVGRPIPIMDGFIAATAAVFGLTLITRNTADFENTPAPLLNPWRKSRR